MVQWGLWREVYISDMQTSYYGIWKVKEYERRIFVSRPQHLGFFY